MATERPVRATSLVRFAAMALAALGILHVLGEQPFRLGAFAFPRFAAGWWAAAAALWLLLAPAASRRRALLSTGACALGLAAVSQPWRPGPRPAPPLLNASFGWLEGPRSRATPASLRGLDGRPALQAATGRRSSLQIRLQGVLSVPASGAHAFRLDCDDACVLTIDGARVFSASPRARFSLPLERGPHAVTLDYVQTAEAARLRLAWDRPGAWEPLPIDYYLSPQPAGRSARELARDARRAWLELTALAATWGCGSAFLALLGGASAPLRNRLFRGFAGAVGGWRREPVRRLVPWVFAANAALLLGLHARHRSEARDGLYLHAWTSEYMMQTVSAADLRDEPLRSLWYLHIQPPLFDAIRAGLALFHRHMRSDELLRCVDAGLYVLWGLACCALTSLVFLWTARLTHLGYALAAAAAFALHPSTVFYAAFLDSTLLGACLVAWLVFELWRAGRGSGSEARLAAAASLAFLTRSAFQWPFLVVLLASLLLLRWPWRRALRVGVAVALVMGLYLAKQYVLFKVTYTSTFAADSFCKGLMQYCPGDRPVAVPALPAPDRALVLRRVAKLDGEYNYNQLSFLRRSFSQMAEYHELLRRQSPRSLLRVLGISTRIYLRPSASHSPHLLADGLPWRRVYDRLLGGPALLGLLAAAALLWLASGGDRRRGLALALPVAYVGGVTIVFESGENMRYKFLVEPVLFVFLASQLHALPRVARALVTRRRATGTPPGNDVPERGRPGAVASANPVSPAAAGDASPSPAGNGERSPAGSAPKTPVP